MLEIFFGNGASGEHGDSTSYDMVMFGWRSFAACIESVSLAGRTLGRFDDTTSEFDATSFLFVCTMY